MPPPEPEEPKQVRVRFQDQDGQEVGDEIVLDTNTTRRNLNQLLNKLLVNEEPAPYAFFAGNEKTEVEVIASIKDSLKNLPDTEFNAETVLPLIYKPEAMFRVRPVTRASATLQGHAEAILVCRFSPDGK